MLTPVSPSLHPPLRRDAVFRVLAVEQPQAVVLNYAPGPLDTAMITDLLEDQRTDPGKSRPEIWGVFTKLLLMAVIILLPLYCSRESDV